MSESSKSFHQRMNQRMRGGLGEKSGNLETSEAHQCFNSWVRDGAFRRTWETDVGGEVTHIEGEAVRNRGE